MSKPVKDMIIREYESRLEGADAAVVISMRGMDNAQTGKVRTDLRGKNIQIQIVKNSLARKAFAGTGLEPLGETLLGQNALVWGGESVVEVAREIVEILKEFPDLELKGAVLDGLLFEGEDGVKALSKYPTRDEAIAQDVALLLGPGRKLVGAVKGPGGRLAGILKAIEEKLDAGEAISKIG